MLFAAPSKGLAACLPSVGMSSDSGKWMHRTFSPYEELSICTQTLLAGAAAHQGSEDREACSFETAVGPVTVHRDEGPYGIRQDVEAARPLEEPSSPDGG